MNFNDLMAKMRELDQPVPETIQAPVQEAPVDECGDMPPAPMGMDSKPDTPPPSMSVNINAQGMDDIGELMKLLTKVNPDMINQKAAPTSPMSIEPSITSIAPSLPPLKMLPDLDKEEPKEKEAAEPEGEDDDDIMTHLNKELKPFDDQQEKEKDKEEAFGNSVGDSEPDYKDISANLPNGNDLNRPKKSFSGKAYRGDNPMAAGAYESKETLRANIRTELLQRLAEAKGAK
jgi:hypothetical protein